MVESSETIATVFPPAIAAAIVNATGTIVGGCASAAGNENAAFTLTETAINRVMELLAKAAKTHL